MSRPSVRKSVPYQLTELQQAVLETIMSCNANGSAVSYESIRERIGYSVTDIRDAIEKLTQIGLIQSDR